MPRERQHTGIKRQRSYWATIIPIPIILALLWIGIGNVPSAMDGTHADHRGALRIVACNLNSASNEAAHATALLQRLNSDVICLYEWTGQNLDLDTILEDVYRVGLSDPRPGAHGTCILVRRDLEAVCSLVPNPAAESCRIPIATLRVIGDRAPLSILGVHVPPPTKSCGSDNGNTIDSLASWISAGRLTRSIGVASKSDPVILAGDLNAIPYSAQIRKLRRVGLQEAWSATHLRPILTWRPRPSLPRVAQLDYIMVGDPLDIRDCWVIRVPGSDHCLIMADIEITEEAS